MMYYQPTNKPSQGQFTSLEHIRRHGERLENIRRLISYNNKRLALGLKMVTYPPALIDIDG